jgi:hypothetical protein
MNYFTAFYLNEIMLMMNYSLKTLNVLGWNTCWINLACSQSSLWK